jgi:hypothetical protein
MALTTAEFEALLNDRSKRIDGDLSWGEDEDHSPAVEFSAEVISEPGWPLFVRGSYNPLARTLTFALILKTEGRIYALDLGKDHHNPQCTQVGERHKHRWTERLRDKEAYAPEDISAAVSEPVAVWRQFCQEATVTHGGTLAAPPAVREDLFR